MEIETDHQDVAARAVGLRLLIDPENVEFWRGGVS
jgi:hypothetical protein